MRARASAEYDWWFRAAYPSVARTVLLILHDSAQAQEIAQDAFVQLYRHWSTIQDYERPDLWVRRVAIRLAVRQVKRSGCARSASGSPWWSPTSNCRTRTSRVRWQR